jgi:hypothetical protein
VEIQDGTSAATEVRLRFTGLSVLGESSGHYLVLCSPVQAADTLDLKDCSLQAGAIGVSGSSSTLTCSLFNNLLECVAVNAADGSISFSARNNLFWRGSVTLTCVDETLGCGDWSVIDNLFDTVSLSATFIDPPPASYNAYKDTSTLPGESSPIILTNTDYQVGPLGAYYYPTNGGQLSTLINAGSSPANDIGLYHFTCTTNQVKETNSTVDIGLHWIAVDANGNPKDSDGDGIPDYLEDANGSGSVDSGETDWQNGSDLGLKVWITQPKNNSNIP